MKAIIEGRADEPGLRDVGWVAVRAAGAHRLVLSLLQRGTYSFGHDPYL